MICVDNAKVEVERMPSKLRGRRVSKDCEQKILKNDNRVRKSQTVCSKTFHYKYYCTQVVCVRVCICEQKLPMNRTVRIAFELVDSQLKLKQVRKQHDYR
jgi:hypothetical protein